MGGVEQLQDHRRPLVAAVAFGAVAHPVGALVAECSDILVKQRGKAVDGAVVRVDEELREHADLPQPG